MPIIDEESIRFNLTCATCGVQLLKENATHFVVVKEARDRVGWTQNPNPVCNKCSNKVRLWRDGRLPLVLKKRGRRRV